MSTALALTTPASRYLHYQQYNPRRSPRWRYERALALVNKNQGGGDDELISRLRRFIRLWDSKMPQLDSQDDIDNASASLFYADPALFQAYDTFVAGTEKQEFSKYALEGRILAGQTNAEIAQHLELLPESVEAYEKCFFHVRERLRSKDYIVGQVIGTAIVVNDSSLSPDFSAKFFGYFGGPFVLDAVLYAFDQQMVAPVSHEGSLAFFDEHCMRQVRRRIAEAAGVMNINRFNVAQLLEIHAKVISDARKASEGGGATTEYTNNVKVFLQGLPFTCGSVKATELANGTLGPYLGHNMELRADEVLAIESGEPGPDLTRPLDRDRNKE